MDAALKWDDDNCLNLRVGPWEFLVADLERYGGGADEEPESWGATVRLGIMPDQPDRLPDINLYFTTREAAWSAIHGVLGAFGVEVPPLPTGR